MGAIPGIHRFPSKMVNKKHLKDTKHPNNINLNSCKRKPYKFLNIFLNVFLISRMNDAADGDNRWCNIMTDDDTQGQGETSEPKKMGLSEKEKKKKT